MAAYTAHFAKHVTATAAAADSFLFDSYGKGIRVANRAPASTNPIYFTVGKDLASTPVPTVGGDDTYVALPFTQSSTPWLDVAWPATSGGSTVCVRTIVTSADVISVMVLSEPFG